MHFLTCLRDSFVQGFVHACTIVKDRALQTMNILENRFVRTNVDIIEIQIVTGR